METNTLVRHKKLHSLGIGCVSKILSKTVKVNFGTDDVKTCNVEQLVAIDISECKTISLHEYKSRILKDNSTLDMCIVGNELRRFVGIGWTVDRVVTYDDLDKYPRVV